MPAIPPFQKQSDGAIIFWYALLSPFYPPVLQAMCISYCHFHMWFFNVAFRTLTRLSTLGLRKSNKDYKTSTPESEILFDINIPFVEGWRYGSVGKGTHCRAWEFDPYHHICEGELTPTSANIMCMPPHTNKHNALYFVIIFRYYLLHINIVIVTVPWFLPAMITSALFETGSQTCLVWSSLCKADWPWTSPDLPASTS